MLNGRNTQGLVGEGGGMGGGGHRPLRPPSGDARSQPDRWQGASSAHFPRRPWLGGGAQKGGPGQRVREPGHGGEKGCEDQGL